MNIIILEQVGTEAVRKFDYQMAVALDFLFKEINDCLKFSKNVLTTHISFYYANPDTINTARYGSCGIFNFINRTLDSCSYRRSSGTKTKYQLTSLVY